MTTSAGVGGSVPAAGTLLGGTGASLGRGAARSSGRSDLGRLAITTIDPYFSVMNFAKATVRLTAVAFLTKQLNIGSIAAAPTGKRNDMVVFQIQRTATAPTGAAIPRVNDLFRGG
jgi:hypothetical protein